MTAWQPSSSLVRGPFHNPARLTRSQHRWIQVEWTQATWNPTTGCDKVSAGCDNCYALTLAKRLKAMGADKYQHDGDPRTSGPGFGITIHPGALGLPYTWRTLRLVFGDRTGHRHQGQGLQHH